MVSDAFGISQIVTFDFQARFSYIAVSLIFWRLFAIVFYLLSALSLPYLYLPYRLCACRQSFGLIQIGDGVDSSCLT